MFGEKPSGASVPPTILEVEGEKNLDRSSDEPSRGFPHDSNGYRIIGGENAPEAYSPHMAAMIFGERNQFLLCGGSIVTLRLVLTAAHCIEAVMQPNGQLFSTLRVRVGSNKWNSGGTVIPVVDSHMHPQWDSTYIKYDVGVLVLQKKVTLGPDVGLVSLDYEYVGGDERCVVTGWGRTGPQIEDNVVNLAPTPDRLQLLYVNTLTHSQCQEQLRQVAANEWTPHIQREVEICTFHSRGHGMCMGDSGSALIQRSTGRQIGIVSWGFGCAEGAPDVFVRLYGVKDFVETYLKVYKD
ncbi:chymotrypsin-2-like [Anticarsia gemmatalis]|uniref:chymotrypsin-2-like n=1 Tax=Anticarsia gemmatalis TaxID=129554 RepID=UPI003F75F1C4